MNKNKQITIAVDIDDTLAKGADEVIKYSNEKWNLGLEISDYSEDWSAMWGVDHDEVFRRASEYFKSGSLLKYQILPNSKDILKKLSNNYRLIILSARNDICRPDTILWIKRYFGDIFKEGDLFFADIWNDVNEQSIYHTKSQICKNLQVDLLIDDQLKHCIGASEVGIKSILFGDYNWNKADNLPDNIRRANNWLEVPTIIDNFYE